MATPDKQRILMSDLILQEQDSSTGFTRDPAHITPPAANGGVIKIGTLVFRAKGLDRSAPWTVLSEAADLSTGAAADTTATEVAIFLGDAFSYESETTLEAVEAGKPNAVVLAREAVVASWVIEQVNAGVDDLEGAYAQLQDAGVIVEKSYGVRPTV